MGGERPQKDTKKDKRSLLDNSKNNKPRAANENELTQQKEIEIDQKPSKKYSLSVQPSFLEKFGELRNLRALPSNF